MDVSGTRSAQFPDTAVAVAEAVSERGELGVQVAVAAGGALLLDVAAGVADPVTSEPVSSETLFPIFSVTKALTTFEVHLLVARGACSYDDRISAVWPEFGAHGKTEATVGDALAHRTGIPHMPDGIGLRELCDWEVMTAAVADLEPRWPSAVSAYHSYTFGWIVGEFARRVDGRRRSFGTMLREDVFEAFGLDCRLGLPDQCESRVAVIGAAPGAVFPERTPHARSAMPDTLAPVDILTRPEVRRSEQPAVGAFAPAGALARFFDLYARGEGLAEGQVDEITRVHADGHDPVVGAPLRKGLGVFLAGDERPGPTAAMGPDARSWGHTGFGGSVAWVDSSRGVAVAILKNAMRPAGQRDDPVVGIADAIRRDLDEHARAEPAPTEHGKPSDRFPGHGSGGFSAFGR